MSCGIENFLPCQRPRLLQIEGWNEQAIAAVNCPSGTVCPAGSSTFVPLSSCRALLPLLFLQAVSENVEAELMLLQMVSCSTPREALLLA